jgi:penicillin amidase
MFKTAGTQFERITRLLQIFQPGKTFTLEEHGRIQHDALSLRAAADLKTFTGWTSSDATVERARQMLEKWDAVYARDSAPAALYEAWRSPGGQGRGGRGRGRGAEEGPPTRETIEARLKQAVERLTKEQGADWSQWRWGRMHTRAFPHPFVAAFNIAPVERNGGAGTVAADGASYREIFDVSNWDRSLVINTPGQSGQPGSPFYDNLAPLWGNQKYFELAFSRPAVDKVAKHRLILSAK